MCGITGIFSYHYAARDVSREELRSIRDHMAARGPDGKGEWFSQNGKVALGHRRLAIIDLTKTGAQPMSNEDGSLILVFNGEIYNYRELRKELETQGVRFFSSSDTEVILRLYEEYGEYACSKLRGMFAFALWDSKKNALLMARDPSGIKPLYYADDGWTFRFASQVKALLKSPAISKEPELAGITGFFLLGSVPEPFTIYQDIRALPAGSAMWVTATGSLPFKKYFTFNQAYRQGLAHAQKIKSRDVKEYIQAALQDSIKAHLVSDVPVGFFLSSGVDSSLLLALTAQAQTQTGPIQAITLAFDEYAGRPEDEAPLAKKVAASCNAKHFIYRLARSEFYEELPKIFEAMDQPSIDGVNIYFISKAAKACGLKVALSGIGGDELWCGYSSFSVVPRLRKLCFLPSLVPFAGELFRYFYEIFLMPFKIFHPKFAGLFKFGGSTEGAYLLKRGLFMPWELAQFLPQEDVSKGLSRLGLQDRLKSSLIPDPGSDFARISILESQWYLRNQLLRDTDWASMAHSVEVRAPYVDTVLFGKLVPLLAVMKMTGNKSWIGNYFQDCMPQELIRRKKTGFTIPMSVWLHEKLKGKQMTRNQSKLWARTWAQSVFNGAAA